MIIYYFITSPYFFLILFYAFDSVLFFSFHFHSLSIYRISVYCQFHKLFFSSPSVLSVRGLCVFTFFFLFISYLNLCFIVFVVNCHVYCRFNLWSYRYRYVNLWTALQMNWQNGFFYSQCYVLFCRRLNIAQPCKKIVHKQRKNEEKSSK